MTEMRAPAHAAHDPELIAAYAAGDAEGDALARASALVAECSDCARLHRDLRALRAALASVPAPARPRDFRLTAEQAAALRAPTGWRRLLAPLGGARSAAGPIAASMAALGVAGLLLSGGVQFGMTGSSAALAPQAAASRGAVPAVGGNDNAFSGAGPLGTAAPSAAASAAPVEVASAAASAGAVAAPSAAPSLAAPAPGTQAPAASVAPVTSPGTPASDKNASSAGGQATGPVPPASQAAVLAPTREAPTSAPGTTTVSTGEGSGPPPLFIGSLVLLIAGIALGVLRLVARRVV